MKLAYVDSSCLIAIVLGEAGSESVAARIAEFDRLISSNLLEAEFRAVLAREGIEGGDELLFGFDWIHPDRPLTPEFSRILAAGLLKGADLWHVACALFVTDRPEDLSFLTLDRRQAGVARRLGFPGL